MASIEAAHTSSHEHVITAPHADSAILGCDTVINLAAAIDTDSGPGIAICAQIVHSSQTAGPSVQSIDTPSRDRAITNRDVDVSVYQYTAERSADTEHGETAQVERDAVGIDPDPTFAALANDVIREAI